MSSLADTLYNMYKNGGQYHPAVVSGLFGRNPFDKSESNIFEITIFDGLYKGLFLNNVSPSRIMAHFWENSLDDLIHDFYEDKTSGYYDQYKKFNLTIGKTYLDENNF